jgi:hypothetical protein
METLLSVRGEAQRTIPPDYVTLWCALTSTAASKAEALGSVRTAKDSLISGLGRLGGVALTVESGRSSLTWSVGSLSTRDEHDFNKVTGSHGHVLQRDGTWTITNGPAVRFIGSDEWANRPGVRVITGLARLP